MKTITVKLCNPVLNIVFAVLIFFTLLVLFNLMLARYLPPSIYHVVSFFLAVITSGFSAKYLSRGNGKIELDNDLINITVLNEYLNRDYSYTLQKKEINAFEIFKTNLFTTLIFYRYGKAHKSFTLLTDKDQENALVEFLKNEVRFLDKKGRLSSVSFLAAFTRSLAMLLIGAGSILLAYIGLNWLYYSANKTVLSINLIYWLLLTILFLLIYNIVHYKNNFRIGGRYATWLVFLFLSTILYLTLIPASYSIFQQPLYVESLPHNVSDYSHKFLFTKQVSVDTTQIGYFYMVRTSRKSRVHVVTHYFTTPALDLNDRNALDHHAFIGRSYEQKIRRSLDNEEKGRLRISFSNSRASAFKTEVVKPASFYEVLYHQNNKAFKAIGFRNSALSAGHYKSPVMVVKPHHVPFEKYRESQNLNILTVSLIALVILAGNALIIASNR